MNPGYEAKLREIFEEEREKLKLSGRIELIFLEPPPPDYYESLRHWWACFDHYSTGVFKNEDGSFTVQFNPRSYKRGVKIFRRRARHELFHIYFDGERDKIGLARYLFVSEPLAALYGLGLRIDKIFKRCPSNYMDEKARAF